MAMSDEPEVEQVIEINLNAKYVLVFNEKLTMSDSAQIRKILFEWLQSDEQFLVLGGDVTLKRIDE
jgi:hypothetical protein